MVIGTFKEQLQAIELILSELTKDHHYSKNMTAPFPYTAPPKILMAHWLNESDKDYDDDILTAIVDMSDKHMGFIVGRRQKSITQIGQVTGTSIKVSDRCDFMPGTTDRKITISGLKARAIFDAIALMSRKVYENDRSCRLRDIPREEDYDSYAEQDMYSNSSGYNSWS